MSKTKINTKLTFYSNVNTQLFNINSTLLKAPNKNLKNFLYFLCLYHYVFTNNVTDIKLEKPRFLITPKVQKKFTLLRAPFRHKLTKKNYSLTRYKVFFFFSLVLKQVIKLNNIHVFKYYINTLIQNIYWFETNVQHLHKIDLFTPVLYKKLKL